MHIGFVTGYGGLNNMLIQLNNNQCLCIPGAGDGLLPQSGVRSPLLQHSLNTTVMHTITTVYCLCLTHSLEEMACKILFVWRSWGCLKLSVKLCDSGGWRKVELKAREVVFFRARGLRWHVWLIMWSLWALFFMLSVFKGTWRPLRF